MSGYWGTILFGRSPRSLVGVDGVRGFGYRHERLRACGDGWQVLETSGFDDPPDLGAPSAAVAAATGEAVFAAYVSDSYCAVIRATTLTEVGPHWELVRACGAFRHEPRGMPPPVAPGADEAVAGLTAWADAAGLRADPDMVRQVVTVLPAYAEGQVFDLAVALGMGEPGEATMEVVPVEERPFVHFASNHGIARMARERAARRAAGRPYSEPEPLDDVAMALEEEMWAARFRQGTDVAELARRAQEILDADQ